MPRDPNLRQLSQRHILLAYMLLNGHTKRAAAAKLDMNPQYVGVLSNSPLFQAYMESLRRELKDTTFDELQDWLRVETAPMIATLEGLRGALTWSSGWLDLELVALNPELGEYFGTTDGLLVIRAPEESELQVQGGDVILTVDGRPVSSQAQLMRILRSYEAGEDVKLDVMRQKRRTTLTVKIPERTSRTGRYEDFQWDFDWNHR